MPAQKYMKLVMRFMLINHVQDFNIKHINLFIGYLIHGSFNFMMFYISEEHVLLGLNLESMLIGLMLIFVILVQV